MGHQIWKVRHQAGDKTEYFSYAVRREGFHPLLMTADQFTMLFPDINAWSVPEAPKTATLTVSGVLVL